MFGTYRLALALIVMMHHLLAIPVVGQYAVFSFFVISGFLMTAVMAGTYGYGTGGFLRFAANRALRLYPAYLFAVCLAICVIVLCGETFTQSYRAAMFLPRGTSAWAANLSMIFPRAIPYHFVPRLLPATWALTVELTFYVLIGLGLSRTRVTSLVWLAASLIYTAAMFAAGADYYHHYALIPAGSLPFATGACIWHWRDALGDFVDRYWPFQPAVLMAAGIAWFAPFALIEKYLNLDVARVIGLYLNIPIAALVTIALFHAKGSRNQRRYDSFLGDYSYPVYLLHWPMGALASWTLFEQAVRGLSIHALFAFVFALVLTFLSSSVVVLLVDPIVSRVRATLKRPVSRDGNAGMVPPAEPVEAA